MASTGSVSVTVSTTLSAQGQLGNRLITRHVQGLDLGAEVVLFEIDLRAFGQGVLYWVLGDEGATAEASVTFGQQVYVPFPFAVDGFDVKASGPLPRPNLVVSDVGGVLTPLVEANEDFIGGVVRRIITYERFLDGQPDADPASHKPIDEFIISKLVKHDPEDQIQWELRAAMDLDETELPARQAVRDYCDLQPRVWDPVTETFDYEGATCPFAEAVYLDENGESVDNPEDEVYSKKLVTCCKARFGNGLLPFGGFPGLARIKLR